MKKVSVIIPAYNEEKNIEGAIKRVKKSLKKFSFEIIVVDDGSTDNTYKVAKINRVICVRHEKNMGKGAGFRTGISKTNGEIIAQIDADSQFLPEELPKLIDPILKDEADVTLGSRFIEGAYIEPGALSLRNKIGNYGASLLTTIACMRRITDVQAGFKAFKKKYLRQMNFKENKFGYEPEIVILAARKKLRIKEVPILYKKRRGGQSNIKFIQDAYNISKTIFKTIFSL